MNKTINQPTHLPLGQPKLESFWTPKRALIWVVNIFTAGIYSSVSTLYSKYHITQLEVTEEDLRNQIEENRKAWSDMEIELLQILEKMETLVDPNNTLDDLSLELKNNVASSLGIHQLKKLVVKPPVAAKASDVALRVISFIGALVANILTLGIYGVCQDFTLKNRFALLQTKTEGIKSNFATEQQEKLANLKKLSELIESAIQDKQDMEGIKNTPQGQTFATLQKARQDMADLQKKYDQIKQNHDQTQQQITSLRIQMQTAQSDLNLKDTSLQNAQKSLNLKDTALNDLQNQLDLSKKEANRLQSMIDNQGKIAQLTKELGPIPPKYLQRSDDKELIGAMDIDSRANTNKNNLKQVENSLNFQTASFYKAYNIRYGDKKSAAEVVEAGFTHAFNNLIHMKNNGIKTGNKKINLNESADTPGTAGEFTVYRYMILDFLKGGKIPVGECHGYKLMINKDVSMLPSRPEKVLQFKDQMGTLEPTVTLRYSQRDDFTTDYESLQLPNGVDAPAAKWILEQLSDEEMDYLFTHLMAPVIESTHPDYVKMRNFMQKSNDPRVKLVETASEIIQNMASALQNKFGPNVLASCWEKSTLQNDRMTPIVDVEPFVKLEDITSGIDKIQDTTYVMPSGPKIEEWTLNQLDFDEDVSGIFVGSQLAYKNALALMDKAPIIANPLKIGTVIPKISWTTLQDQYYRSHQMIGSKVVDNEFLQGPHRCLFSNLMAVLSTEKNQLTVQNAQELRNAMGKYLKRLQNCFEKDQQDLFRFFTKAILDTHHCDIDSYIKWLMWSSSGKADIDMESLTALEITLCAYTVGVNLEFFELESLKPL